MGVGEFELIARLAPYLSGHGDDAAVLDWEGATLCVTIDVLVDGRHFRRDLSSLADVGWKAVAVNCSDLAAMGATPRAAVVGLCRPPELDADDVEQLYTGMHEAAQHWGLALVGGDTVAAETLTLALTALGGVADGGAVRRSGARIGDAVVLVGALGAGAAGLALAEAGAQADPALLAAHRRPRALVAAGRVLAGLGATAMIDVSDGLGADLAHVCEASGVGAVVHEQALPVADGVATAAAALGLDPVALACGGGEDFALVATLPQAVAAEAALAAAAADGVSGAVVGEIVDGSGPILLTADGQEVDLRGMGYDHYRDSDPSREALEP